MNSGYVGFSRSVRSKAAIEDFEMPLSLINKETIRDFLKEYQEEFKQELVFLEKLSVEKWKYIAKEHTSPASWHHTSSYFNETDHYDLYDIANNIIQMKNEIDTLFNNYKNKDNAYKYGVMKVQIWGGSRKRPKLEGHEVVSGLVIGKWLHYKSGHQKDGSTAKYKVDANKVEWLDEYDSYDELIKEHKAFKSTKRVFNRIIKEKVK